MSSTNQGRLAPPDPRILLKEISGYARPIRWRSLFELAVTIVPFVALLTIMWWALVAGHPIALLLALPAGGLLVRLFLIQHDCGHGSFFAGRAANDWLGRAIGILTLTPYHYWQRTHAVHHARTGNLDGRGMGDIATMTRQEYQASSQLGRLRYRLYRNPVLLFGIGPFLVFLFQHRLPVGLMRSGWRPWASAMATNAAILLVAAPIIWLVGLGTFLLVYLPVVAIAASAGAWLFYVQHQFEHATWDRSPAWRFHDAALHGSSHYDLPVVLRWLTANIGIHHVHHLSSRIPCYRLAEVLRDRPELREMGRLTLRASLKTASLALWDEEQRHLISFREANASVPARLEEPRPTPPARPHIAASPLAC